MADLEIQANGLKGRRARTVLIVEDEPNDLLLARLAFEKAEVANPMVAVHDGEQAQAYLAGEGEFADRERFPVPALVLLDLHLPRISGLDVLRWMRQNLDLRHIPVVVLTVSDLPADIEQAYELGANSYLVKPMLPDHVADLVKSLSLCWADLFVMHRSHKVPGDGE